MALDLWICESSFVPALASGLLVLFLHLEDLLYVVKAKPHDRRMMCDSPIVQTKLSQNDSLCKYSHSSISCDSEFQSEVVKDDSLSKVLNDLDPAIKVHTRQVPA
ncbi:uncharacterized protein LOC112182089 isoform X1 [Rosa chinensis]|uniref:uncharacterized protein LOC112182089 isoform X1 n=1 Tax=Rosa chinensis TaxID=74649 RepID=UPI000D097517|nr:uncharacterized protein LOC112182089 isoform X1 [Rosa chinensis]